VLILRTVPACLLVLCLLVPALLPGPAETLDEGTVYRNPRFSKDVFPMEAGAQSLAWVGASGTPWP
jgi:hypothetical protein